MTRYTAAALQRCRRPSAFTLVELLVVIGIIALLISILLPSLQRARKSANAVKCAANLRSILQSVHIYAAENKGAIPGSAHTTARFVYKDLTTAELEPAFSNTNCPTVIQIFDWASPVAKIMGIPFNEGPTDADRTARYEQLRDAGPFHCPDNEFLNVPLGTPTFAVGRMVSYNTALGFLVTHNGTGSNGGPAIGRTIARTDFNPPQSYNVSIPKVGGAAEKIYIADGARYSRHNVGPDANLHYTSQLGGAFSDQGAWGRFTNAWHRGLAQGNGQTGRDTRLLWARHGGATAGAKGGAFKFNAGFFDGHVELLDDLQGANPTYWFPSGTSLAANGSQMFPDVLNRYFNGVEQTYIVP